MTGRRNIMPELPEVETIRLGLQRYLIGHKILDIDIKNKKTFQGDVNNIIGSKVIEVKRLGKILIIVLNNSFSMAIHLKMTGQLIYSKGQGKLSEKVGGNLPNKWTRVIFKLKSPSFAKASKGKQNANLKTTTQKSKLKDDSFLYFNDIRKFGWIRVVESSKLKVQSFFKDLGPEPPVTNSSENNLTMEQFSNIVSKSNIPVKVVLMDQKKIAGIGNIYANEALFLARIDPRRSAKQIASKEIKRLYSSIIEILKRGIKYGGSSDVNYVNALGQDGKYQEHFLIYGRKGEKCFNCGGDVHKIVVGGRGTYFCPECQR